MILRFLETIAILYCIASYLGCAYVLWYNWKRQEAIFGDGVPKGEAIIASVIFLVFAPIVVANVLYERVTRPRAE